MPNFANCEVGIEILNPVEPPAQSEEIHDTPEEHVDTGPPPPPPPVPVPVPLEEYSTQINGSIVTTWIASESGKVSHLYNMDNNS